MNYLDFYTINVTVGKYFISVGPSSEFVILVVHTRSPEYSFMLLFMFDFNNP